MRTCNFLRWGSFVAVLFVFDRITKWFALNHLAMPLKIADWFSLELMFNRGVSFGLFYFDNPWGFFIVTGLVSFILCIIIGWTWQLCRKGVPIAGQLFIIVGAASNIIDRVLYGGVIDFVLFSWGRFHWPLFNVADVLIDIGVFILILQMTKSK
jgi:signal peptidase II